MCPQMCPQKRKDIMKERSGYIYQSKGKWIARVTTKDNQGKRRNLKKTAKTKSEAKSF